MTSVVMKLTNAGLAHPPGFLPHNMAYETIMGSHAYGVADNETSDFDVYGFCIPPLEVIFPHLRGEILDFGTQKKRFRNYQEQHMLHGGREYDLSVYSIVAYFDLVMGANPNMVDSLFTPLNCVLHITQVGQMVRDARHMFLSKKVFHTFRGYAYQQMAGMTDRKKATGKRKALIEEFGFDVKFAYHTVRLLEEAEQILAEGDLDLQRSKDILKGIRRGMLTEQDIRDYFTRKEAHLTRLYEESKLPYGPDEDAIKGLLLNCLEQHYGSLSHVVHVTERDRATLEEIYRLAGSALYGQKE